MRERIESVTRLESPGLEAVEALIRRATEADGVPPVGEHKYLKLHGGSPRCWALLAYRDDRLVGYSQVLQHGAEATAEVVVHPDARRSGVARRLIAAARDLALAQGAAELRLWAYGALPAASAIAAREGLRPIRTLLQLERPLADLPRRPPLRGYVVRAFDPARDRETWLRLHNAVFAEHPENGKWSRQDLEARLAQPWFDAADFLIAEADGEMVGFNWLKRIPALSEGEIYVIGVAASQRGRGLGRALALAGLHHLRALGLDVCTLYVESDNSPALALYRALGFTTRHTHRCYALPLPPPAAERSTGARPCAVEPGPWSCPAGAVP